MEISVMPICPPQMLFAVQGTAQLIWRIWAIEISVLPPQMYQESVVREKVGLLSGIWRIWATPGRVAISILSVRSGDD